MAKVTNNKQKFAGENYPRKFNFLDAAFLYESKTAHIEEATTAQDLKIKKTKRNGRLKEQRENAHANHIQNSINRKENKRKKQEETARLKSFGAQMKAKRQAEEQARRMQIIANIK